MKAFSLEGKCEKCGGENIGVQYCDDSYRCSYKMRHLTDGEHMHRFCPRCLYAWAESCQAPKKEQERELMFQDVELTPEQRREGAGLARWMEAQARIAELEARCRLLEDAEEALAAKERNYRRDLQEGKTK